MLAWELIHELRDTIEQRSTLTGTSTTPGSYLQRKLEQSHSAKKVERNVFCKMNKMKRITEEASFNIF